MGYTDYFTINFFSKEIFPVPTILLSWLLKSILKGYFKFEEKDFAAGKRKNIRSI
jgi:hypothetical protein